MDTTFRTTCSFPCAPRHLWTWHLRNGRITRQKDREYGQIEFIFPSQTYLFLPISDHLWLYCSHLGCVNKIARMCCHQTNWFFQFSRQGSRSSTNKCCYCVGHRTNRAQMCFYVLWGHAEYCLLSGLPQFSWNRINQLSFMRKGMEYYLRINWKIISKKASAAEISEYLFEEIYYILHVWTFSWTNKYFRLNEIDAMFACTCTRNTKAI